MNKKEIKPTKMVGTFSEGVEAIILTSVENYIPDYLVLKTKITNKIFTTKLTANIVSQLENDTNIVSIEINKKS